MAKITLSKNNFTLIPEGETTFKVMGVDDSKYEDFGKINVSLQTAKGEKHTERFTLVNAKGELNEGALKAWSYFAKVCLNNFNLEEIDTQDIVGCYIKATVKHEVYTRTKGDKAGEEATTVRLNDYAVASGFTTTQPKAIVHTSSEDLSDFDELDDLDDLD